MAQFLHRALPLFVVRIAKGLCCAAVLAGCAADSRSSAAPVGDRNLQLTDDDSWLDAGEPIGVIDADMIHRAVADGRRGFTHVADIAVNKLETVAVLDRQARRVLLFSTDWRPVGSFGRTGDGPGEFRDPVAIEAVGNHWLVWDRALMRFSVFDQLGAHLITRKLQFVGDSNHLIYRQPTFGFYQPFPGNVDLQERVRAFDDSTFVMEVEDSEWTAETPGDLANRRVRLLRYNLLLHIIDTVHVAPAPILTMEGITTRIGQGGQGGQVAHSPPTYTAKLLWTAGSGHAAVVDAGSLDFPRFDGHWVYAALGLRAS